MAMVARMGTAMIEMSPEKSLYTLQTWFSPSYPVGAYTYSHGLENAFEAGLVTNIDQATDWIKTIIENGAGFSDAVFVSAAYQAASISDQNELARIAEYATAYCTTKELRLESHAQGAAFIEILQNTAHNDGIQLLTDCWDGPCPYCVCIGAAASNIGIEAKPLINAYLHAFVSNLSSALVRLVPFGQTDGQRIISALALSVEQTAAKALKTNYQDVSTSTLMVDLTSMQHETQYTRLFRS